MREQPTGQQIVERWLDTLEHRLRQDAEQAGLFAHPTMTGSSREFFVRQVLGSFLPRTVRIGTGKIMGADSTCSAQMDVVIFDDRYPAFSIADGQELFPIEGVVATIEVKSHLDKTSLNDALDKCASVARIGIGVYTDDRNPIASRDHEVTGTDGSVPRSLAPLLPRSYIFGFRGLSSQSALNSKLKEWLERRIETQVDAPVALPSMVVAGGAMAVAHGDPIRIKGGEIRTGSQTLAELDRDVFMYVFDSERCFGWLASHLLYVLDNRRLSHEVALPFRLSIQNYLPFDSYFEASSTSRTLICGPPHSTSNNSIGDAPSARTQ